MANTLKKPAKIVDLHAHHFLDNWEDYEPDELLGITLEYFRENLDAAIYWEFSEIKFIHGKGKGVLKSEVYNELREYKQAGIVASYYPDYHNEDIVVVNIGI